MNSILLRPILLCLLLSHGWSATWQETRSVSQVVDNYPKRVELIFNLLDLKHPGLENTAAAWQSGDRVAACKALLAYYATAPQRQHFQYDAHGNINREALDKVFAGQMTASGVWYEIPLLADDNLDWSYMGPPWFKNNQGPQINRMPWLRSLCRAALQDAEPTLAKRAAATADRILRDWSAHTVEHQQFKTRTNKKKGEHWIILVSRKFDAGLRMIGPFPQAFHSLIDHPDITDATKILFLSAILEHGPYLREHHVKKQNNHQLKELNGLAVYAAAFPEAKASSGYLNYVDKLLGPMVAEQFYMDEGVQAELCQNYHGFVLDGIDSLAEAFRIAGHKPRVDFSGLVERGFEHIALTMKPNGQNPAYNDTNPDWSGAGKVRKAAKRFNRPDWLFPLSNGSEGTMPAGGVSQFYPLSGRIYSRNHYGRDADWSTMDAGPAGTAHDHNDKLHVSIHAGGRDLLVDAGRYTYEDYGSTDPTNPRGYVRRSWGHNVILVAGESQNQEPKYNKKPITTYALTDDYDFLLGSFDQGWFGKRQGTHQRAFFYLKNLCWVVIDQVTLKNPEPIQALWHYHPEVTVSADGLTTITTDADASNLRMSPLGLNDNWRVELVRGREKPTIQGWYSKRQGVWEPATCAIYHGPAAKMTTIAWLLTAGNDQPASLTGDLNLDKEGLAIVTVSKGDQPVATMAVDFTGDHKNSTITDGLKITNRHAVLTGSKE